MAVLITLSLRGNAGAGVGYDELLALIERISAGKLKGAPVS